MYQLTRKKTPLWAKVIGFLFLCGISSELLRIIFRQPTLDEELIKVTQEINPKCPLMIDTTTRLDNTAVLTGKRLLFNYTIIKRAEEVKADTVAFQQVVKESLVNMIKTNPRFAPLQKVDMSLAANWYDDKGNYLCSVLIEPEDYR